MSIKLVEIKVEDLKKMDLNKIHEIHALDSIDVINEDGSVNVGLSMMVNKLIIENMKIDNIKKEILEGL